VIAFTCSPHVWEAASTATLLPRIRRILNLGATGVVVRRFDGTIRLKNDSQGRAVSNCECCCSSRLRCGQWFSRDWRGGVGPRHLCLVSQSTHSRDSVWFRILNVLLHLLLSYLVYLPQWTRPLLNLTLYSNKLSHCILKVPMLKVRRPCLGGYFGVLVNQAI
jgi:hypothetical protein